jgi:hypothetical protein
MEFLSRCSALIRSIFYSLSNVQIVAAIPAEKDYPAGLFLMPPFAKLAIAW